MPCVACFVLCPHFVFQVRFRMSRCISGCASDCDNVCDVCLQNLWRPHTFVVVLPSEPQVVQHACTLRSGNVFRVLGLFSFQHLGKSRVAVCFRVFNCRNSMRDRPLCRTLWSVESLIARELHSRLCVAVMFTGAYYVFRDFAFLLLVVVSVIFTRCSNSV